MCPVGCGFGAVGSCTAMPSMQVGGGGGGVGAGGVEGLEGFEGLGWGVGGGWRGWRGLEGLEGACERRHTCAHVLLGLVQPMPTRPSMQVRHVGARHGGMAKGGLWDMREGTRRDGRRGVMGLKGLGGTVGSRVLSPPCRGGSRNTMQTHKGSARVKS